MTTKQSSPRPAKKRTPRPSVVRVRATSDRRGTSITFRSHGSNNPDLRDVLPDLLQAKRPERASNAGSIVEPSEPIATTPPASATTPPTSATTHPAPPDPPRSSKLDCLRLGTFEVTGGAIRCTDPCYEPGSWCAHDVRAAGGTWQATAFVGDFGDWGKRVQRLRVDHEILPAHAMGTTLHVGVDSGQFGFFDAARYPEEARGSYEKPRSFYGRACRKTLSGDQCGMMREGVVSASGMGDGSYELSTWVDSDGRAVALEVVFLPEDHPIPDLDDPDLDATDLNAADLDSPTSQTSNPRNHR